MVKAFISYSWDNDEHKNWVRKLAARLRSDGIDVTLDQWHLIPGDQLSKFMEQAVRESDYVLIVCTHKYKERSNNRQGGVGYEGDIMTAEVMSTGNQRKFIPILRQQSWSDSAPSWLSGKYYIDFSTSPYSQDSYDDLITTLLEIRAKAPPLGTTKEVRTPTNIHGIDEIVDIGETQHHTSNSEGKVISLENVNELTCLEQLKIGGLAKALSFTPNGNFLAVSSNSLTSSIVSLYFIQNNSAVFEHKWRESHLENYKDLMYEQVFGSLSIEEQIQIAGLKGTLRSNGISRCVSFSPDGLSLVSSISSNKKVRIWRVGDGKLLQILSGHESGVESVIYSPNGDFIASGSSDRTVRLYHAEKMALIAILRTKNFVSSLAFSPDSTLLASGGMDRIVSIWQINKNGAELIRTLPETVSGRGYTHLYCEGIVFFPNNQVVAIAIRKYMVDPQETSRIELWNAKTGELVKSIGSGHNPNCIALSPDGRIIVSGESDGKVRLYNIEDGKQIYVSTEHRDRINSICFHPNNNLIATASDDGTVRLWGLKV